MKMDFEKMGKEKYLKILTGAGEERDSFACNMISEAQIDGLVGLYHVPAENGDIYKYNITGMLMLDDYLTGFYSIEEVVSIMTQIVTVSNSVRSYALSQGSLIYSISSIYIDTSHGSDMKVKMVAVPLKGIDRDGCENLRNLLIQILGYLPVEDMRVNSVREQLNSLDMRDDESVKSCLNYLLPEPVIKITPAPKPAPKKKGLFGFAGRKGGTVTSKKGVKSSDKTVNKSPDSKMVGKERKAASIMDSGLCINIPAM